MKRKGISSQSRLLHSALIQRGVEANIEKWDNHKHVDISIDSAGLYLEIDGDAHYLSAGSIMRDLKRDYYSTEDGFDTLRIPNYIIDSNIDAVADALSEVCRLRYSGRK